MKNPCVPEKEPQRRARVLLVFSPYCPRAEPHLALARLVGYLQQNGVACQGLDLNVRFLRWLMTPGGLLEGRVLERIERFREREGSATSDSRSLRELEEALQQIALTPRHLEPALAGPGESAPGVDWLKGWSGSPEALVHHAERLSLPTTVAAAIDAGVAGGCPEASTWPDAEALRAFLSGAEVTALIGGLSPSDVVGLNVSYAEQLFAACVLSLRIRERTGARVVWGGSQITLLDARDRERLAALSCVDALCLGEGEGPLLELVRRHSSGAPFDGIPGLLTRAQQAVPAVSPALESLPTPVFDDAELALYPLPFRLPVTVTQGCYWGRCQFCDSRPLAGTGYRVRPPALVAEDVARLVAQHGRADFALISDALPPAWCAEFSRLIVEQRVKATFWGFVRAERPGAWSPERLTLMAAAGFTGVTCGVESTTDRVLRLMNKGTRADDLATNLRAFAAAGIDVTVNIIPDYPTVTLAEAQEGLEYLEHHRALLRHVNPQGFRLSLQSGIARDPTAHQLERVSDDAVASPRGAHMQEFRRLSGMTEEERRAILASYVALAAQVNLSSVTAAARERLASPGFSWEEAAFVFRRSLVVRSARSLLGGGATRDVFYVLNPTFGTVVEIDGVFESLAKHLGAQTGRHVPFVELRESVADAVRAEHHTEREIEEATIAYIELFVESGMVWTVSGDLSATCD